MRLRTLIQTLALFCILSTARSAHAGDFEGKHVWSFAGIAALLAADAGFTIYDVSRYADGTRPNRAAAAVELAIAAPQAILVAVKGTFRSQHPNDRFAKRVTWTMLAWTSLLAVHGAYFAFTGGDNSASSERARPIMLRLGGRF